MNITSRSTKAEILAAYHEQQTILASGASWSAVWAKFRHTATVVSRETIDLIKDCYRLGQWARKWYDLGVAELSGLLPKN